MKFNTVEEGFKYLEGFANFEKKSPEVREYSLERMFAMLADWGNPHRSCKAVHVAGSKGKGSTCAYMAALLAAQGLKVGIYASPHVLDYRERIRTAQGFYSDDLYLEVLQEIHDYVENPGSSWELGRPTTFELLTLCAFLVFRKSAPDWVVLETGLGGRLDATNVIVPQLCLITDLELEHTEVLGPCIEHIAREKAGIFKQGVPVISQIQPDSAQKILINHAEVLSCPLEFLESGLCKKNESRDGYTIKIHNEEPVSVVPAMHGDFQAKNLSLALLGLQNMVKRGLVGTGPLTLQKAALHAEKVKLTARLELFRAIKSDNLPLILLDAGHTVASVNHMVAWVHDYLAISEEIVSIHILIALAKDKDAENISRIIGSLESPITITKPGFFKESAPEELIASFNRHSFKGHKTFEPHPEKAFALALDQLKNSRGPKKLLIICGSFYLCGAVYQSMTNLGYRSGELT